jgi:hypothetical protein
MAGDWLVNVKAFLKRRLDRRQIAVLRRLAVPLLARAYASDLTRLGALFETDKGGYHGYCQHYQRHFRPLRRKRLNILEIGIGGWDDPRGGGGSLRMWQRYFPNSMVYGIDVYDKKQLEERRIRTFQGRQDDVQFLDTVVRQIGRIDIIIDDGSHINKQVIKTFQFLFPHMMDDGIYVVEDTDTSYLPEYGGSADKVDAPSTILGFFKGLLDDLTYDEHGEQIITPSYFRTHIASMHFYHNLILVHKGLNAHGMQPRTADDTRRPEAGPG